MELSTFKVTNKYNNTYANPSQKIYTITSQKIDTNTSENTNINNKCKCKWGWLLSNQRERWGWERAGKYKNKENHQIGRWKENI